MYKVTFRFESGEDVTIFAAFGENLLEVARKANVAIDAPCSGNVSCGKCRVQVLEGSVESSLTRHITHEEYDRNIRLACNCAVSGDVTILVPDIAAAYRARMKVADLSSEKEFAIFNDIRREIDAAGIRIGNDIMILRVEMDVPDLNDTLPDNERLIRAICKAVSNADGGFPGCGSGAEALDIRSESIVIPYYVMRKLPDLLRQNDFRLQCTLRVANGRVYIYDIAGAEEDVRPVGLAVDIGTTSVAALAVDLRDGTILAKASAGNAQIRYGADVINRIVESAKDGGLKRLQKAIINETLEPMIESMCRSAGLQAEHICRLCVASNTTMNHLFTGINPDYLRMEPFIPAFFELDSLTAGDLGLPINPNAKILLAPNVGSYVGGDITAGAFASMIWNKTELSLFIDLGTNGELVLGNQDFLMSCACSAGPAFEGGDISCGMRATDGAIDEMKIDEATMEPTFGTIGGQTPVGICGSGIIDTISELYRCGIIDSKGKLVREGRRVVRDEFGIGSYIVAFKEETGSVRDVVIDEVDIDNFIRAKGAIFSAIRIMLDMLEMDVAMIEHVYVAGGIGSGINMRNAVRIGMLPDIPAEKYSYIGNSSLAGAFAMLLSKQAEQHIREIGRSMTYVELSTNNKYMDEFVAACFIPHTDESLFSSGR